MSAQTCNFRIDGITPILMHCGQTANPLNQFAKAMKRLSGKRGKTEEDLAELAQLEWWAGLYLSDAPEIEGSAVKPAKGSRIVIPAHVLDSCIREGARKAKMGKQASAGCIVGGDGLFEHDGPKDLVSLSQTARHAACHAVKVGTAKVMRTRPTFPVWSVTFSVEIDTTVIEPQQVLDALIAAGRLVGIGDWRPGAPRGGSFGRFLAEQI
jgi:hypothetical protein